MLKRNRNAKVAWSMLLAALSLSVATAPRRAAAGMLHPGDFASLGQLPDESGQYQFNTSGAVPVLTLPDGSTINGVFDPTGQIAVFTFNSINLDQSPMVTAQGSRPLALLSQGDFNLGVRTFRSPRAATPRGPGCGGRACLSILLGDRGGGGFMGAGGHGGITVYLDPAHLPPGPNPVPGGTGGTAYGNFSAPLQGGSAGGQDIMDLFPVVPGGCDRAGSDGQSRGG